MDAKRKRSLITFINVRHVMIVMIVINVMNEMNKHDMWMICLAVIQSETLIEK